MTDNTPLKRALDEYIRQDYARLHMPGHKGASISPFGELMAYDVTEVVRTACLRMMDRSKSWKKFLPDFMTQKEQ